MSSGQQDSRSGNSFTSRLSQPAHLSPSNAQAFSSLNGIDTIQSQYLVSNLPPASVTSSYTTSLLRPQGGSVSVGLTQNVNSNQRSSQLGGEPSPLASSSARTTLVQGSQQAGSLGGESRMEGLESIVLRSGDYDKEFQTEVFEIIGPKTNLLSWTAEGEDVVVKGLSDLAQLSELRNALFKIRNELSLTESNIRVSGAEKEDFDRRLLLLEHTIEGLLRRRITFAGESTSGRVLDYTGLLNEKENQIVELEKKIQNFQELLQRASKREADLEDEIVRLKQVISALKSPSVSASDLQRLMVNGADYHKLQADHQSLKEKLAVAAELVSKQFSELRTSLPQSLKDGVLASSTTGELNLAMNSWMPKFAHEDALLKLLRDERVEVRHLDGVVHLVETKDRVVEVPVQDGRTKSLVHMLAIQMRKYFQKYPKLAEECDRKLYEYFQRELIDVIETDELDRLVEIVKYVPEVVKVENVYAYSSEKQRKVEFHLRVLIKALLDEMQRLKSDPTRVPQLDEGVMGLIQQEIMGMVEVDDILKVFRVVPKIVEVEKIVEKVVERVVEIPQVIPVEKTVEKIVEVIKIQEVDRVVHVPVEVVKYVDREIEKVVEVEKLVEKIVEIPRVIEKVVDRIVEIPKVTEVEVFVEKVVEVEKPVIVEKIVNHTVPEIKEVIVEKEKLVPVEKIVREVVEVEKIVEKVVEKIVHVPKVVEVEKIVEKPVKLIEYLNAKEVSNHIEYVPQIVEVIREKVVPVTQIVEQIVEVAKTVEKIVPVREEVVRLVEVEKFVDKIVYQDRIKEVEKPVTSTVQLVQEVEKVVERKVEVPFYQERILRVPEIVTQIVIERVEIPKVVEVVKNVDRVIEVAKIVEVEKPVNHYITQQTPVRLVLEKIVEVPRTVERLKEVRVHIDKIVEKMVEVPKVVEVEKIVEKVVVVPRVIEKIVEVPQVVEVIVDRLVEVEKVKEVEKIVEVPVIQEKVVEVEKITNSYIEVEKPVEKEVERIVEVEKVVEVIKLVDKELTKIVPERVEVPKEVHVDRIVPRIVEVEKIVHIDRPIVVPVEVQVPMDRLIEKLVPVEREVEKIVQVTQEIDRMVPVRTTEVQIQEAIQYVEKPVIHEKLVEVERVVPYISETLKEVPVATEKVVVQEIPVKEFVEVPTVVEKIAVVTNEMPRIYEVEKFRDRVIQVPQIYELPVDNPILVRSVQVVEALRDRPIEVPVVHQEIVEVNVVEEKIVTLERNLTEIKEVVVHHDKIVEKENFVTKTDIRHAIETEIQTVDRFEEKIVPIYSSTERFVEVPHIIEKIVEKIVVMPQVVEVLKYVHEIVEEQSLGVAVSTDVSAQELRYQEMYAQCKQQFELLLAELRKTKQAAPTLRAQIEAIEAFLMELDKVIRTPRIVQVEKEKTVNKEVPVPVLVPTKDSLTLRNELSMAVLVEKLVRELKHVRASHSNIQFHFDEDLELLFFSDVFKAEQAGQDFQGQLKAYRDGAYSQLFSFGREWSSEHEVIINAILDDRIRMANLLKRSNGEIEKVKADNAVLAEGFRLMKASRDQTTSKVQELEREVERLSRLSQEALYVEFSKLQSLVSTVVQFMLSDVRTYTVNPALVSLHEIHGSDDSFFRLQSAYRALQQENELLQRQYVEVQQRRPKDTTLEDKDRVINNLTRQLVAVTSEVKGLKSQVSQSVEARSSSQEDEMKIRTLTSRIHELESELRRTKVESDNQLRSKESLIRDLEERIGLGGKDGSDSRVTGFGNGTGDRLSGSRHSSESSLSNIKNQSLSSSSHDQTSPTYGSSVQTTSPIRGLTRTSASSTVDFSSGPTYGGQDQLKLLASGSVSAFPATSQGFNPQQPNRTSDVLSSSGVQHDSTSRQLESARSAVNLHTASLREDQAGMDQQLRGSAVSNTSMSSRPVLSSTSKSFGQPQNRFASSQQSPATTGGVEGSGLTLSAIPSVQSSVSSQGNVSGGLTPIQRQLIQNLPGSNIGASTAGLAAFPQGQPTLLRGQNAQAGQSSTFGLSTMFHSGQPLGSSSVTNSFSVSQTSQVTSTSVQSSRHIAGQTSTSMSIPTLSSNTASLESSSANFKSVQLGAAQPPNTTYQSSRKP